MTIRGSCLCGSVEFELDPPTKFCVHCHCSICRRAHGAPFVTWTAVKTEKFRLTAGETTLRWYDSSKEARRGFCSNCVSPLFFESRRWPGETHIAVAELKDAIDQPVQGHVFFDDKAEWVKVTDDLARYGGPTGTEPLEDSAS